MAQHIDNLRGEQGGAILSAGDSFDASTYGSAQVVQVKALEDGTTFSNIKFRDVVGGEAYFESYVFERNDFIDGVITEATVSAGAVQVFLHKRSDA